MRAGYCPRITFVVDVKIAGKIDFALFANFITAIKSYRTQKIL